MNDLKLLLAFVKKINLKIEREIFMHQKSFRSAIVDHYNNGGLCVNILK